MIDESLFKIDDALNSFILYFDDGMFHGFEDELKDHGAKVLLNFWGEFGWHVAHGD